MVELCSYRLLVLLTSVGDTLELMFLLVLYYFCMYLCDDDICTDADIDEVVTSYSLTDDDLELVAESMWIDFDEVSAFYYW